MVAATVKAVDHHQAETLIKAGKVKEIELAYDIDSDDFFQLATLWGEKGAKISKNNEHFVITLQIPMM